MEAIDELGTFWVADNPDDKLSGRLIFDPQDGAQLSIVGEYAAIDRNSPRQNIRFHGLRLIQ